MVYSENKYEALPEALLNKIMERINAKKRGAKKELGALRRGGVVPAVLYGKGNKNVNLSVDSKEFDAVFRQAGESTLVDLAVEGKDPVKVLIHDVAINPITNAPIHIDFYQVRTDEKIKTEVQLVFKGESAAVKELGGVLVKNLHELEIEALPQDLINSIEADISKMKTFDDHIYVKDLLIPPSIKVMAGQEDIVASVVPPREEEAETKEEPSIEDIQVVGKEDKGEKAVESEGEEKSKEEKEENS